jgi:hypothetical protein
VSGCPEINPEGSDEVAGILSRKETAESHDDLDESAASRSLQVDRVSLASSLRSLFLARLFRLLLADTIQDFRHVLSAIQHGASDEERPFLL